MLSLLPVLNGMSDVSKSCPILYHYPMSPFSEKIRVAMGAFDTEWRSVNVPAFPPRLDVSQFIGGYRRIPVLQIGAQFFCDTSLAYKALFESETESTGLISDDEDLRQWAETDVFFAVLSGQNPISAARFLTRELGVMGFLHFTRDRIRMMQEATVTVLSAGDALAVLGQYVEVLSERLGMHTFISGEAPGYLDFSCYHPLWMAERVKPSGSRQWPASVCRWMNRMRKLGHGMCEPVSIIEIETTICEDDVDATTWSVPNGWRSGDRVMVAPLDYGSDASSGRLVSMCDERIVIRRQAASGHPIYVHFPCAGFSVMRR